VSVPSIVPASVFVPAAILLVSWRRPFDTAPAVVVDPAPAEEDASISPLSVRRTKLSF